MPAYCFTCESCGHSDQVARSMDKSDMPLVCSKCGKGMIRDYPAEAPGRLARCDTYPFESDAAGGHPDDRARMTQEAIDAGVPTEINHNGNPVFRTPIHRKKYLRAFNMYDRNASYGDPEPVNGR